MTLPEENDRHILSAVVDAVRVIASDLAQLHTDREVLAELYQAGSDMEQAKLFLGNHRNYVSDLEKQIESLKATIFRVTCEKEASDTEGTRLLTLCREKEGEIVSEKNRYEQALTIIQEQAKEIRQQKDDCFCSHIEDDAEHGRLLEEIAARDKRIGELERSIPPVPPLPTVDCVCMTCGLLRARQAAARAALGSEGESNGNAWNG